MNAKQWKAGLLSVAMLASMVVPAAAATPEEGSSQQPVHETSLVTEVVPAADNVEESNAPPALGSVWGPTGELNGISLTLICTTETAAHTGGNSKTSITNFLSTRKWDSEHAHFYQEDGVWYATCSLDADVLLTEQFGEGHTVTENPQLTLVYQNSKWCIQSAQNPVQITVEGTCGAASPAAPVLGTNMDIWVQTYLGEYAPVGGGLLGHQASTYESSLTFGQPYESEGQWLCDLTIVGYTSDAESSECCFVNKILSTNPQYTIDPVEVGEDGTATKTVTLTYNQSTGKWVAPELPEEYTSHGPGDTTSQTQNGVAFKLVEKGEEPDPNTPEAPNKDNCSAFYVTVYGTVPQVDGSVVNKVLLSFRWDLVSSSQATYEFGQPTKNDEGIWTCDMTIDASEMVSQVQEDHNTYRIVEEDPSTKTITLNYNENTKKWSAPSDGVTKNGVAFQLLKQFSMTFTPGLNGQGEAYESPLYDAGSTVELPETTGFTRDGYVFAGWKTSIKDGFNYINHFYPIGTPITVFPVEHLKLDAYWMNVELSVANTVYDPNKTVNEYTFSNDGVTIESPSGEVTLLYKATVLGNGYYPYELSCDGAEAVYGSSLSGEFSIATTKLDVYFTKTYSVDDAMDIQETVTMGNASDSVSTQINVDWGDLSLNASGADVVYTGDETAYTLTAAGENGDRGSMAFSFLLDGQYQPNSVKLEALNNFMMMSDTPVQTENGMLYKVILTQMSGVNALSADKQTEVLRITLTAADQKGQIILTPVEFSFAPGTTGLDLPGAVGGPVTTQVWVQYDVNDDGQVSLSDVNMLKVYYQAHKGDENWSQAVRADLNGDGMVDVQDLSLLMQFLLRQ